MLDVQDAARVFTDPSAYADLERFHRACALLRREAPVTRVDVDGFHPFFAVTRHDDVMEVSRHPERWLSAPRPALGPKLRDDKRADEMPVRTLVQMDAPDHLVYRQIVASWFKPRSVARLAGRAAELSERFVDRMAELDGECDFVTDVALHYPLYMILSLLGLPEEDYGRMLKLTQEVFGSADPELARADSNDGMLEALMEFVEYFQRVIDDRRANPRDDLASAIANAAIAGEPIRPLEVIGYYVIIATAGHDTTSSAIAGGMHALAERPDQLRRLLDEPALVPTAVEEMIRWVSPVKQFMRTATEDSVIRGVEIPARGSVLLSYPSANRDEDVFDRADEFDVARTPNRHLAFGFGAHYCLGTHLARLEMRSLFDALVTRLRSVELARPPAYAETLFVGGPKHLPIRYELR